MALLVILTVVIGSAAWWMAWAHGLRTGLLTALLGVVGTTMYLVLRQPPASRGGTGADRIDFGR